MRVFSAEEMREVDRKTAEDAGISTLVLMENAGRAVAEVALDYVLGFPANDERREGFVRSLKLHAARPIREDLRSDASVIVVAGTGNNGGDGFVAARHLLDQGVDCGLVLAGPADNLSGDARTNFEAVARRGIAVYEYREEALEAIEYADVIIDALFGTGMRGDIPKDMLALVNAINHSDAHIVAVDIPSGVNADSGEIGGEAVVADVTVTLGAPKLGLLLYPGADCTGDVIVADIGIPSALLDAPGTAPRHVITAEMVTDMIPDRSPDSHKGTHGRAGLFAGSPGLIGAAAMAGQACSLAGAGMTTVATPAGQYPTLASRLSAECMTLPLGPGDVFQGGDVEAALAAASEWDAVAIGCGLGRDAGTQEFVRQLLPRLGKRTVIDADGLFALGADAAAILPACGGRVVITPHPGEMARLLGTEVSWVQSHRLEAATRAAADFDCVCVLKGANTIVAEPGGLVFFNVTGNYGLAKGGAGDALTGIILSFLAQGAALVYAPVAGVWAHGRAADFAAEGRAKRAMTAVDVAQSLSKVFTLLGKD